MNHLKEKYDDVKFGVFSLISPVDYSGELLIIPSVTRFGLEEFNRGPYDVIATRDRRIKTLSEPNSEIVEEVLERINLDNYKILKRPRDESFSYSPFGIKYPVSDNLREKISSSEGVFRYAKEIKINPSVWGKYMIGSIEGEGATKYCGVTGHKGHYNSHL